MIMCQIFIQVLPETNTAFFDTKPLNFGVDVLITETITLLSIINISIFLFKFLSRKNHTQQP